MDNSPFDDLKNADLKAVADKVFTSVQSILPESLAEDAKENIRAVVNSALRELDVVSKEEFDTQVAILAATRAKLETLETQLKEIEEQLR